MTQTLEWLCMTTHQYRLVNYTKSVAESTAYCSHFTIRQQGHIMFLSVTELGRCRINLQLKVWAVNLLLLFKYWVEEPEHAQYDPSAHPPLIHTQIHSAGTPQSSAPPELIKGLIESIIGLIAQMKCFIRLRPLMRFFATDPSACKVNTQARTQSHSSSKSGVIMAVRLCRVQKSYHFLPYMLQWHWSPYCENGTQVTGCH